MEQNKKFGLKRADCILIGAVLLLAAGVFLWIGWKPDAGSTAVVEVDGNLVGTYDLSQNRTVEIEGIDGGRNTLVIADGAASVTDADCPDKLCVHQADIRREGQTIVCLPHRVVVTIRGGEEDIVDGVAK